jgi:hypothetical protein
LWGSLITYENIECYHSGIVSPVRRCHISRHKPERISSATGVPIETLQAEKASTSLGWGSLEKAHLLSNATGQSFDDVVALHQSGKGWGKIAHDNGLNLGKLVSTANRSSQATAHAQNLNTVPGKSTPSHGRNATGGGRGR